MTDTLAPVVPLTAATTRVRKPNRRKGSCPSAGYITEIGYPEPDRGPLQVLSSKKPAPVPAGAK